MKHIYILFILLLLTGFTSQGYSCDVTITGAMTTTLSSGQVGCMTGNYSGSLTVDPGATLRICGVFTISGSVQVNGLVILTSGSSINITGSFAFNYANQLQYEGDAACYAEMYKTSGTANVLMPAAGNLCNSSRIYLDGWWFQWGDATRGSAQLGRAPSLCSPVGSCVPCATATVGGSVTSNASVCSGSNSGTLTLSGHTGNVVKWQYSTNGGGAWTDIANTTTSQGYTNLATATLYRAIVQNGSACTQENSSSATISMLTALSAGSIGTAQTIFYNSIPSKLTSTVDGSGGGGVSYLWQFSTDGSSWSDIGGATSSTYSPPSAITQDTWYRRKATSTAGCGVDYTASVKITIVVSVCAGDTPPSISESAGPSGGDGAGTYTYQWQSSTDNVTFSDIAGATSSTYSPTSISQSTWYRRAVSSGACTAYTTSVKATVGSSPGGVSNNLLVWLKADAGTGSIGTSWQDQSVKGNHYTTVAGPSLITSDENYNPAVEILSGGFDAPVGAELGDAWTCFFVAKKLASDNDGRLFDGHTGNWLWGYHSTYRNGIYMDGVPAEHNNGIAVNTGSESRHLFSFTRESTGGAIEARADGKSLKTFSLSNNPAGIRIDIDQGAWSAQASDARISEILIYNSNLTPTEIQQVESYLAMKYGLSLNTEGGGANGDYVSADGTTIWDASINSTYNNDIIGLGKDCGYLQKQSHSKDDSLRVFVSNLAATNALNAGSITNDASYLIIGHNDGLLKSTTASNAEVPTGIARRLEREWKITNTNFADTYSLEIEWDSSGAFDIGDLRLLVDDDGDFTDAVIYGPADGLTFSIGSIIVSGIDPDIIPADATKYVTLGSVDAGTPLPIELIYFKASCTEEECVHIEWKTVSEQNNDFFTVERSFDMLNFESVLTKKGAGNSNHVIKYEATDIIEHIDNNIFYRLKQTDFDGQYSYSDIIAVNAEQQEYKATSKFTAYPVPIDGRSGIYIIGENVPSEIITISLLNATGEKFFESTIKSTESSYFQYFCDLQEVLNTGTYFILLRSASLSEVIRFMVVPE